MLNQNKIKELLKNEDFEYKNMLFSSGYLFSNRDIDIEDYPFYKNWKREQFGNYYLYVHNEETFYTLIEDEKVYILIGHAYDIVKNIYDENIILSSLTNFSTDELIKYITYLAGVFVFITFNKEKIIVLNDCGSLKQCHYSVENNQLILSSHVQLIADIYDFEVDEYPLKLINTKCYNIGNRYLPGNITLYKNIYRLPTNHLIIFENDIFVERYYPFKNIDKYLTIDEEDCAINDICEFFHRSIELIIKKWKKPAISLSGGVDSRFTFACANGLYEKLQFFSFISKDSEYIDAEKAHNICNRINIEHKIYYVPKKNEEIIKLDLIKKIFDHSNSYILSISDSELRKYIYMKRNKDFDVDIKSWMSEVGRLFMPRKYNLKFGELFSRQLSVFQTRFFLHPFLLKRSDVIYEEYIAFTKMNEQKNILPIDLYYWEIRMGNWGANCVTSHLLSNSIAYPFNSRLILEKLLGFSEEKRLSDYAYIKVVDKMNKDISFALDISIENKYHSSKRILMEKSFYLYKTMFKRR